MRVFKSKWFAKFARKEGIADRELCGAVDRAARGLIDADLGGGLIKQRVARQGAGKSGGYRTVLAYRSGASAFFVFGFAKSDRENLDAVELLAFREIAGQLLKLDEAGIADQLALGQHMEIVCDGQELQE